MKPSDTWFFDTLVSWLPLPYELQQLVFISNRKIAFNERIQILTKILRFKLKPETLYVPLNFWFSRSPGLAMPLIAKMYHDVKINITFNPRNDTYIPLPTGNSEIRGDIIDQHYGEWLNNWNELTQNDATNLLADGTKSKSTKNDAAKLLKLELLAEKKKFKKKSFSDNRVNNRKTKTKFVLNQPRK
jgi:hypothetical protein